MVSWSEESAIICPNMATDEEQPEQSSCANSLLIMHSSGPYNIGSMQSNSYTLALADPSLSA